MRHRWVVAITHGTDLALTRIEGRFETRTLSSPTRIATLTGRPAKEWRKVTVTSSGEGIEVTRRTNGAGRWMLHDLHLAERMADAAPG
ncbi:MAG: hypothetical protein JJE52_00550 [Acidimicrobiia bacterium]|nr:hypothetical protein [Acidimicrobiia bacterium]